MPPARLLRLASLTLGLALVTSGCGGGGGPTGTVAPTSSSSASSAAASAQATSSEASSAVRAGEIKLGAVLPLTGSFAGAGGKQFEEGYTMAVDEVNKAGGLDVGGKKMKVSRSRPPTPTSFCPTRTCPTSSPCTASTRSWA